MVFLLAYRTTIDVGVVAFSSRKVLLMLWNDWFCFWCIYLNVNLYVWVNMFCVCVRDMCVDCFVFVVYTETRFSSRRTSEMFINFMFECMYGVLMFDWWMMSSFLFVKIYILCDGYINEVVVMNCFCFLFEASFASVFLSMVFMRWYGCMGFMYDVGSGWCGCMYFFLNVFVVVKSWSCFVLSLVLFRVVVKMRVNAFIKSMMEFLINFFMLVSFRLCSGLLMILKMMWLIVLNMCVINVIVVCFLRFLIVSSFFGRSENCRLVWAIFSVSS